MSGRWNKQLPVRYYVGLNMDTDDLLALMRNRRTVREFSEREIPEEILKKVLDAATLPPSGADNLPFTVIIVKDQETMQKIKKGAEAGELAYHESLEGELKEWFVKKGISHEKSFLTGAPALLIVASDKTMPYWKESVWITISYMLLALESEGLATVTYTPTEISFIHEILDIPDNYSLEVILPVGYPVERPAPKNERPEGRIYREKFGKE